MRSFVDGLSKKSIGPYTNVVLKEAYGLVLTLGFIKYTTHTLMHDA